MNKKQHVPVLLDGVLCGLNLKPDGCYVDATFGRGGHSGEIVRHLGSTGQLLAIDRDPHAVSAVEPALANDPRFELIHGEFSELRRYALERQLLGKVDGLLLDLGVSSPQLDEAERGFSFQAEGPLDMRMDPGRGISAGEWLAEVDEKTLKTVIAKFGEERFAARIARSIVSARANRRIATTRELADIVASAVPQQRSRKHPATKTFQAIRMFVNEELEQLAAALEASLELLCAGGRLCVISFHSLEDRQVKRFIRNASLVPEPFRGLPEIPLHAQPKLKPIGKAVKPGDTEIAANARARSARLRIAERL
ncbi:MAG: 16S rRNA (cytosine(1402)-N(4))-methyltransferase RsmH [Woeseiaceae bacterium]|nr:16S rRNA (cytosine(1402)-N(4))-methyltransferase RsmH [Woeseiaceae bacterium]